MDKKNYVTTLVRFTTLITIFMIFFFNNIWQIVTVISSQKNNFICKFKLKIIIICHQKFVMKIL